MLRLNVRQWVLLLASGVMLALHFLLWMGSLRLTSVASSTVILALEPILILAGSVWLFKAKINRMMLIGMGIALFGSIIIGAGDFQVAGTALQGDILSLLGTMAVAVHMLLGQFLRTGLSAFSYNFWVFLVAACTFAVYNLFMGHPFGGYAASEWGIFLLLAIVPTIFGHYLFNWLLQYMNATTVSMGVLGEPVFSSLLAWVLLGEALSTLQMSAGVVILFGVWIFIRYGKTKPQPIPADAPIAAPVPVEPKTV